MFDNTDGKLFPSQFVNIRLLVDTLQNQTVIPVAAMQRGADGTFVFVVSPDKVANQRTVKLGVQDGDNVAITEGLKPGDTVVVDGADRLRDGADVTMPNPGQAQYPARRPAPRRMRARTAQARRAQAAIAERLQRRHRKAVQHAPARPATRDACLSQNRASLQRSAPPRWPSCAAGGGGRAAAVAAADRERLARRWT